MGSAHPWTFPNQRADVHKILLDAAQAYCIVRTNSRVVKVDPDQPSIELASGEVIKSDLVVGADGVHSRVRDVFQTSFMSDKGPKLNGDACYRAVIPISVLRNEPELLALVNDGMTCWMGPQRHIMAYSVVRFI